MDTYNTVENKTAVAPVNGTATIKQKGTTYTFPRYSYTVITLTR